MEKTIKMEGNMKKKVSKDVIVEDLNKLLDDYFAEKSQELKLKYGDVSPDQTIILDDSIEAIAEVIVQWAKQNSAVE